MPIQKSKSKRKNAEQPSGEGLDETSCCASSDAPWDAARKLKLVRHDYRENEVIDPGVNFFVLTLEAIGAKPKYSCEGHPSGFYVLFQASYELAMEIEKPGYFTVELSSRSHGRDWWCIRVRRDFKSEKDKRQTLRWAATAWQKAFWHNSQLNQLPVTITSYCNSDHTERASRP